MSHMLSSRVLGTALGIAAWLTVALLTWKSTPVDASQDSTRQARASWWDRTSPDARGPSTSRHYRIRSDLPAEVTQRYAAHMDTMYDEYMRRLDSLRLRTPPALDVMMFATRQDYLDTLRTQFGIDGSGSGGMFFVCPRGAALAFFAEGVPDQRVLHVMQHEGFHQAAHAYFGSDLPPWLNEGLAEFFGEAILLDKSVILGQSRPQVVTAVGEAAKSGNHIPFLDLLAMTHDSWNQNVASGKAELQYNQSWSMVHFLVYGDDARYQKHFERLLHLLNGGALPLNAFEQAFGLTNAADVRIFEEAWARFALSMQPSPFATALERGEFLAEGIRFLHAKDIRPATLADLKSALQSDKFTYEVGSHGYKRVLSADDDTLFELPGIVADPNEKKPLKKKKMAEGFNLVPVDLKKLSKKQRALEEAAPSPPAIVTVGLKPSEFKIVWERTADSAIAWRIDLP
ncbi:MAG: DUF1570 domain-containing protein [Planctomycetota bacterium]|nr:DUF1570 domain-containing protein [Planctomycetota bacterium]